MCYVGVWSEVSGYAVLGCGLRSVGGLCADKPCWTRSTGTGSWRFVWPWRTRTLWRTSVFHHPYPGRLLGPSGHLSVGQSSVCL